MQAEVIKLEREPWWGKWVHRSDVERCAGNGRVQDRRRRGDGGQQGGGVSKNNVSRISEICHLKS